MQHTLGKLCQSIGKELSWWICHSGFLIGITSPCLHNLSIKRTYWEGNPLLSDSMGRLGKWGRIKEGWPSEKTPEMSLEEPLISLRLCITVSVTQWWHLIHSGEKLWVCF